MYMYHWNEMTDMVVNDTAEKSQRNNTFFACCCGMFDYNHSKPNHNITTYNHNFTYITIEKTFNSRTIII